MEHLDGECDYCLEVKDPSHKSKVLISKDKSLNKALITGLHAYRTNINRV